MNDDGIMITPAHGNLGTSGNLRIQGTSSVLTTKTGTNPHGKPLALLEILQPWPSLKHLAQKAKNV